MSSLRENLSRSMNAPGQEWRSRGPIASRPQGMGDLPWRLILTGAAVVGLGILAWSYLGPDLKRYLKIREM